MIADFAVIFISFYLLFFFFNDTATTEIYTLSLHDALPIYLVEVPNTIHGQLPAVASVIGLDPESEFLFVMTAKRSEEHTSELQSQSNLVCRLLLEKKKNNNRINSSGDRYRAYTYHTSLSLY